MQRVTITIDDELMTELDRIIAARGYQNRSEAIRDLARAGIREAGETLDAKRACVGIITTRPWRTPRSAITCSAKCCTAPVLPLSTVTSMQLSWSRWTCSDDSDNS